jgi:hypothetical protein
MRKLVAGVTPTSKIVKPLGVLSRIRQVMDALHFVYFAPLALSSAPLTNSVTKHRPFTAAQVRPVLFFFVSNVTPLS